jgi:hypothetical protein
MAKRGKRTTAVWWAVPLSLVFVFILNGFLGAILFFALLFAGVFGDPSTMNLEDPMALLATMDSTAQGLFLLSTTAFSAIATFFWVLFFEKRSLASFGFQRIGTGIIKFARGGIFAIAIMAAMAFGLQAVGFATSTEATVPTSWTSIIPLLILLAGWVVQGSSEEIVTRGLLFQSIAARHNVTIGLLVSAVFFTFMHGMNDNPTPLFLVNLALFSLFACFYTLREASLWGICGYHAMWNFAQGNLFGFAVSGSKLGTDQLMSFTETGPDLWTGGATGPEGGLVTTLAIGVSTVLLFLIKPSPKDTATNDTPHQSASE